MKFPLACSCKSSVVATIAHLYHVVSCGTSGKDVSWHQVSTGFVHSTKYLSSCERMVGKWEVYVVALT